MIVTTMIHMIMTVMIHMTIKAMMNTMMQWAVLIGAMAIITTVMIMQSKKLFGNN